MAIVDDKEKKEKQIFDPLAGGLKPLPAEEFDKDADAYEAAKPPVMGRYDLKVVLAKNGCTLEVLDDKVTTYYRQGLELYIINAENPEDNGVMVEGSVSTFIGRGKKISTMAYLLLKMGYPEDKLPNPIAPDVLAVKFAKWVNREDRIMKGCLCDWQGWSKEDDRTILYTMTDFPTDDSGQHLHTFTRRLGKDKATGQDRGTEQIFARLKRKDWGPSADSAGSGPRPAQVKAAPAKAAPKAQVADDEDDVTPVKAAKAEEPAKAVPAKGKAASVAALLDDDD